MGWVIPNFYLIRWVNLMLDTGLAQAWTQSGAEKKFQLGHHIGPVVMLRHRVWPVSYHMFLEEPMDPGWLKRERANPAWYGQYMGANNFTAKDFNHGAVSFFFLPKEEKPWCWIIIALKLILVTVHNVIHKTCTLTEQIRIHLRKVRTGCSFLYRTRGNLSLQNFINSWTNFRVQISWLPSLNRGNGHRNLK